MSKTIYIVLTDTGTLLSKAIGMYTREDLNHASIAFDEALTEMYSFGRKQRHNPFVGGFVKENATGGIFKDASCAIFSYVVSDDVYERMQNRVRHIEANKEQYRYNFIGLFAVALNKNLERHHAYFCSQFVATLLNESGIDVFNVTPNFVQPHHFTQLTCMHTVYEGDLQIYVKNVREEEADIVERLSMWRHLPFGKMA